MHDALGGSFAIECLHLLHHLVFVRFVLVNKRSDVTATAQGTRCRYLQHRVGHGGRHAPMGQALIGPSAEVGSFCRFFRFMGIGTDDVRCRVRHVNRLTATQASDGCEDNSPHLIMGWK